MKSEEAKKGTKVTWNSPQGRVEGEVVKKALFFQGFRGMQVPLILK